MSKFHLILIGFFGFFIVLGVIIFSAYRGNSGNIATVVIWGTIPQTSFADIIQNTSLYQSKLYNIQYIQKSEDEFDTDFVEALASGFGPDLFMLSSEKIVKHYNKIFPIPYDVFTQRQFKDSFIEGSEIYMVPQGTLALPISADPLVMYWNRSIFRDVRVTEPPKYWDEFYNLASTISKKDGALNIQRSAVSFGEFSNISNAKEIILNLVMQAGSPVSVWDSVGPNIVFGVPSVPGAIPADVAVNFYTEFGNPSKTSYSWNRSLPNSTNYFLGGDLALYFGFASEAKNLQLKNPNLNFDVAEVPVSREGGTDISYARFNAFAITKSSLNKSAAFAVAGILSSAEGASSFNKILNLPPARRDLLRARPASPYETVFYNSAIKSKGWLDPDPVRSDTIFKNMIESITSGRARTSEAVSRAQRELVELLSR